MTSRLQSGELGFLERISQSAPTFWSVGEKAELRKPRSLLLTGRDHLSAGEKRKSYSARIHHFDAEIQARRLIGTRLSTGVVSERMLHDPTCTT